MEEQTIQYSSHLIKDGGAEVVQYLKSSAKGQATEGHERDF